ncbi:ATP-dependent DNA ligase [Variovorax boronicumulans]|uniref:ATP-dependent DNA ligase n=1 Tax=Variovorax boronicumulans TaxID=436515 RepID=UPI0024772C2C|nr:ATP-dependent DNA ligase [Variovorax boronicumulans]MDH6169170.1 ATP-dependent DNA ligase [Variovorax boronicumulans]
MTKPRTILPMLAKVAERLPGEGDFLFEPKWDGFRAIAFHDEAGVRIQSRDEKPLDRYFPDLHAAFAECLPKGCVLDGEIVIATPSGLDFDALQQRVHPAASRVARLAAETPAAFVAFDILRLDGRDCMARPQAERRLLLEALLSGAEPPLRLTPMTTDHTLAQRWLQHFEGAGLDGVMVKPAEGPYQPGKRAMFKVKHVRTADCVVAGFRWHKSTVEGGPDAIGSLLLGLYDDAGLLQHVGMTSSFGMEARQKLAAELAPLRKRAMEGHPWMDWASESNDDTHRMPGARSRWSSGKDLSWEPLRTERVCEVKYDHLQGNRFRHGTTFMRWRQDKPPAACTYAQLEVVPPYELARVFGA